MKNKIYRHFKGSLYEVLYEEAIHTESDEKFVVYRSLKNDGKIWIRPSDMFYDEVEKGGIIYKRFEAVSEDEINKMIENKEIVIDSNNIPILIKNELLEYIKGTN